MFNTPYVAPDIYTNDKGGFSYDGATRNWVDNASAIGKSKGYDSNQYQGNLTRDLMRYQNGLMMDYNKAGFTGLGDQIASGFNSTADQLQYGGVYGTSGNFSPTSGNGYSGSQNPFLTYSSF